MNFNFISGLKVGLYTLLLGVVVALAVSFVMWDTSYDLMTLRILIMFVIGRFYPNYYVNKYTIIQEFD